MKYVTVMLGIFLLAATLVMAGAPKSYQVTGPILEVKDDLITVEKGKEKWEIARDKDTKVTGDLKVGTKVTIHYQMRATSIEAKESPKKAKEAPKKK